MDRLYIKDLKVGDILVRHRFAIKEIEKKISKNNKEYYTLLLSDKTGLIEGKIWADYFRECCINEAKIGSVVEVTGKVDSFNSNPQMIVEKMAMVTDYDPREFLNTGSKDINELYNNIINTVKGLEDEEIKNVILGILENEEISKKYKQVPAGEKVHHNYIGGLVEHVYEMLQFAHKAKEIYPVLNYSELVFGIVLHDIGKIEEQGVSGVILERTLSGYLVGHLTQGVLIVSKYLPENMDSTKKDRLIHLILSHHGELQYGSPVQPMTLEAIALSQIDLLSSRMGIAFTHLGLSEANEKGMTGFSKYLGGALFFPTSE